MIPPGVICRMRDPSVISKFPLRASAMPAESEIFADFAGPPSPLNPQIPVPANVLIVPAASITRIRQL
jgi:hypothetical protein